ncbi:hypothetical protein K504DRAFT_505701 [Pleomassaria siparia CBS 279.74]|uniref:Uncharacterized protein n=1 Tax=Pleomassaria siparia CBS 279.74 TaxID=1314801 RepID=A0A6G1K0J7_9PLEO|nr:hypothetical protein K504DRAFT_505701 [Pleomassaria siparia CBS 279.74]
MSPFGGCGNEPGYVRELVSWRRLGKTGQTKMAMWKPEASFVDACMHDFHHNRTAHTHFHATQQCRRRCKLGVPIPRADTMHLTKPVVVVVGCCHNLILSGNSMSYQDQAVTGLTVDGSIITTTLCNWSLGDDPSHPTHHTVSKHVNLYLVAF